MRGDVGGGFILALCGARMAEARGREVIEYIGVITMSNRYTTPDDATMASALRPFGVALTPALAESIRQYMELLLGWNRKINLTTITRPQEILERHFGESMFAVEAASIRTGHLVDVGSGAGFPGLAIKLAVPKLSVALLESNGKKCAFLAEVVRKLGLENVNVVRSRVEDAMIEAPIEFATCRAVGAMEKIASWGRHALVAGGKLLLWTGAADSEVARRIDGFAWSALVAIPRSDRRYLVVGTRLG